LVLEGRKINAMIGEFTVKGLIEEAYLELYYSEASS